MKGDPILGWTRMDLELRSDLRELDRLARAVEEFGARHRLTKKQIFDLQLGLEEIVTNIIFHGAGTGESPILSSFDVEAGEVRLVIQDEGPAFNPLSVPEPDLSQPL